MSARILAFHRSRRLPAPCFRPTGLVARFNPKVVASSVQQMATYDGRLERRCSGRQRTFWVDPFEVPLARRSTPDFEFPDLEYWTVDTVRHFAAYLAQYLPVTAQPETEIQVRAVPGYNYAASRRLARLCHSVSLCVVAGKWRVASYIGVDAQMLPSTLESLRSFPFTEDSQLVAVYRERVSNVAVEG